MEKTKSSRLSIKDTENTLNCLSFLASSLPVGIWPETFPTVEKRNRSPRNAEKSVSMFSNVAVCWVRNSFPLRKVFSCEFLRPLLCLRSSLFLSLVGFYSSCCGFSRPILSFLRFLSFRFLRGSADTTLCFTQSEGARTRERAREREGGRASAAEKVRDVTRQELIKNTN